MSDKIQNLNARNNPYLCIPAPGKEETRLVRRSSFTWDQEKEGKLLHHDSQKRRAASLVEGKQWRFKQVPDESPSCKKKKGTNKKWNRIRHRARRLGCKDRKTAKMAESCWKKSPAVVCVLLVLLKRSNASWRCCVLLKTTEKNSTVVCIYWKSRKRLRQVCVCWKTNKCRRSACLAEKRTQCQRSILLKNDQISKVSKVRVLPNNEQNVEGPSCWKRSKMSKGGPCLAEKRKMSMQLSSVSCWTKKDDVLPR